MFCYLWFPPSPYLKREGGREQDREREREGGREQDREGEGGRHVFRERGNKTEKEGGREGGVCVVLTLKKGMIN